MRDLGGRHPWKITLHDRLIIWVRYQLWYHNRPKTIAEDYDVTVAYITRIGRGHAHSPSGGTDIQSNAKPFCFGPRMAPTE